MQNKVEHVEDTPSESEGLIKTPRQLIVTIILAFLIPIIGIIMLVKLVSVTSPMGAGSEAQSTEAIAQRIQPVARFALAEVSTESSTESRTGQQVYDLTCATCHASGVAGAPTLGDEAAWAPLIDSGFDEMVRIAIEGVGAMPPRGGNPSLSDLEIARAVAYMANNSGGSFDEPSEEGATEEGATDEATDAAPADADAAPETPAADGTPEAAAETDGDAQTDDAQAGAEEAEVATETAETDADAQPAAADTASPDPEEVQQILTKNACLACHAIDKKLIGPAYQEVAEKHAGAADAAATIAQHIKEGSSGIYGPIPMPPNPGITDEELAIVVDWIMAGAPQ